MLRSSKFSEQLLGGVTVAAAHWNVRIWYGKVDQLWRYFIYVHYLINGNKTMGGETGFKILRRRNHGEKRKY